MKVRANAEKQRINAYRDLHAEKQSIANFLNQFYGHVNDHTLHSFINWLEEMEILYTCEECGFITELEGYGVNCEC